MRHVFPLPFERRELPRFDGCYCGLDGQRVEFAADGTLRWDGEPGTWRVHADPLDVSTAAHDCEGAIDNAAIYLLCADGQARAGRTQLVLEFVSESA